MGSQRGKAEKRSGACRGKEEELTGSSPDVKRPDFDDNLCSRTREDEAWFREGGVGERKKVGVTRSKRWSHMLGWALVWSWTKGGVC